MLGSLNYHSYNIFFSILDIILYSNNQCLVTLKCIPSIVLVLCEEAANIVFALIKQGTPAYVDAILQR